MSDRSNAQIIAEALRSVSTLDWTPGSIGALAVVAALEAEGRLTPDSKPLSNVESTDEREAIALEVGIHVDLILREMISGMPIDTGGLRCSCGDWSAPRGADGFRPRREFTRHVADAILAAVRLTPDNWEYGHEYELLGPPRTTKVAPHQRRESAENVARYYGTGRVFRRRPAGPWEPVETENTQPTEQEQER